MKKLILLVLFVCIGSINAQEKIIVDIGDQKGFDRIHKYYKNVLGDKYEVIKNKPVEMKDIEDVVYWNEYKIRDNYERIGMINEMNFDYLYNISSITSTRVESYDDKKKTFLSTINFGVMDKIKMIELRIKDGRDDISTYQRYYDNFLGNCCSKQTKIYNYEDKLVNFSEEAWYYLYNNYVKKVMLYGSDQGFVGRNYAVATLKAVINYDGGARYYDENMAMWRIKKNGITSHYTTFEKSRDNPSISHLFIQDRYIVSQKFKPVNAPPRFYNSTTEFEFVYEEPESAYSYNETNLNEFDIKPMIELFIEDYKGFMKYYYGDYFQIGYGKQKITATFEPLEGNTLAMSYGYGKDDQIIIKIDPEKWAKASSIKRWYILYHELGHDYLNLEHGQGGKMMFNFPLSSEITIENFVEDRNYMFKSLLSW